MTYGQEIHTLAQCTYFLCLPYVGVELLMTCLQQTTCIFSINSIWPFSVCDGAKISIGWFQLAFLATVNKGGNYAWVNVINTPQCTSYMCSEGKERAAIIKMTVWQLLNWCQPWVWPMWSVPMAASCPQVTLVYYALSLAWCFHPIVNNIEILRNFCRNYDKKHCMANHQTSPPQLYIIEKYYNCDNWRSMANH